MSQTMTQFDDAQHYAVTADGTTVATFTDERLAEDFADRCTDRTMIGHSVAATDEPLTSRGGRYGVRVEGRIEASFGSREIADAYAATMDQLNIVAEVVDNE